MIMAVVWGVGGWVGGCVQLFVAIVLSMLVLDCQIHVEVSMS